MEAINILLKENRIKKKPVNTNSWQGLALEIMSKIKVRPHQRSSVFKVCKQNEHMARIAFLDSIELEKPYINYFFKVFSNLNKRV